MKKFSLEKALVLGVLAVLVACVAPTAPGSSEVFVGDRTAGGELELKWVSELSKSLLSPSVTQAADTFQLVAFSGASATMRVLKPGVANILTLGPGTWRIVLLAGLKRSSTSTTIFLVGAANEDNVVITNGARTAVNLTLRPIDATFGVTGTGIWGENVTVKATGKSRSPVVGMFLSDLSADRHPRFRSLELWNGYKDATVTGTPADWSAEVTAKVPEGGVDLAAWLIGAQLCLLDGAANWVPAQGVLDGTWEWLNRADMADTHPLVGECESHIATSAPPTGLNVTIGWE